MTRKHIVTYVVLAALCVVAYPFGREVLIVQEPGGYVHISTLTLNYVLLFVIAGAISPRLASKLRMLRRFKKSTASGIVMLTLVCALLIILTLAGLEMRWTGS